MSKRRSVFPAILAALLGTLLSSTAVAQDITGFVENQAQFTNEARMGQVHMYLEGTFTEDGKLGFWSWGLINHDWAEALLGLGYSIIPWCNVQAGVGMETDSAKARWAANLWLGHGRWSMLAMSEFGGSGHWRRIILNADVGRWGIGGLHQSTQGIGPRLEYRFFKEPRQPILWVAALVNTDGVVTTYAGARLAF